MIRRYIVWRNRHADDQRLRAVVDRANVAWCGTSKPHPEQGQKERRKKRSATFKGCPPESAGRPHEAGGNVGPRRMAVSPAAARPLGDRTRRTARLVCRY
jgi:hypothetical protein